MWRKTHEKRLHVRCGAAASVTSWMDQQLRHGATFYHDPDTTKGTRSACLDLADVLWCHSRSCMNYSFQYLIFVLLPRLHLCSTYFFKAEPFPGAPLSCRNDWFDLPLKRKPLTLTPLWSWRVPLICQVTSIRVIFHDVRRRLRAAALRDFTDSRLLIWGQVPAFKRFPAANSFFLVIVRTFMSNLAGHKGSCTRKKQRRRTHLAPLKGRKLASRSSWLCASFCFAS